jgi:hypothetical protein
MVGGVIRGHVAILKWQYYDAATIEGYTVTHSSDHDWTATARVVSTNAFNLAAGTRAGALVFHAPIQGGVWRWPIRRYELTNGALRADLGPPLD